MSRKPTRSGLFVQTVSMRDNYTSKPLKSSPMKLIFRLIWLLLTQRRRARINLLDACDTRMRVLPNDLDVLLHVNNGVYLTLADLGRVDLLLRMGLYQQTRDAGWYPVAAATSARFRRSLRLWQRFTITTRVLGWDEQSVYLEQVFHRQGELIASLLIDARFLKRGGGSVPTAEVLALADHHEPSPELPAWVEAWTAGTRTRPTVPSEDR